jgi:hypothetical protein
MHRVIKNALIAAVMSLTASCSSLSGDEDVDNATSNVALRPGLTCTPLCANRTCGPDGCGGTCGSCGPGLLCFAGTCRTSIISRRDAGAPKDAAPPTQPDAAPPTGNHPLGCAPAGNHPMCPATGPAYAGTCSHSLCLMGAPLDKNCDWCVAKMCETLPHCCTDKWDDSCVNFAATRCGPGRSCGVKNYRGACAHDPCAEGERLDPTCDPCVKRLCDDPSSNFYARGCCTNSPMSGYQTEYVWNAHGWDYICSETYDIECLWNPSNQTRSCPEHGTLE